MKTTTPKDSGQTSGDTRKLPLYIPPHPKKLQAAIQAAKDQQQRNSVQEGKCESPAIKPQQKAPTREGGRTSFTTKPVRRQPEHKKKTRALLTFALCLLALIALAHLVIVALMSPNSTTATPNDCNGLLHTTDYTQAVHLQAQAEQMDAVEVFKQLAGGEPAALVQVNHNDAQHTLDVYIFGCITQQQKPRLQPLFTRRGLAQGMAEVSQASTLIISSADPTIPAEESAFLQPLQQNVYQEYQWQHGQFQQVAFPGLYPVASRAEAEALQQEWDAGQAMPWNDPLATTEQLARDIFKWPSSNPLDSVVSNDGTTAQVQLVQANPHMVVQVTLKRLIRRDNRGLWFVVSAHTQGITVGINEQNFAALPLNSTETPFVKSTFTLHGASALADGQTSATLFDHTLTPISAASNVPLQVNSDGTYSGTLSYANVAPGQQGLLLIQSIPISANSSVEDGQLLLVGIILQ